MPINNQIKGLNSDLDSTEKRPNLIYVFADQLRLQSCGYFGGYADEPPPHTPNIDDFQRNSFDFRNTVSSNPMCAPYRASLLTGKYQSSTGMVINELRIMPDPDALGHVLSQNGYRTGYIGKWHLYGKDHSKRQQFVPPGPYRMGFDDFFATYNFNHHYFDGFYFKDEFIQHEIDGYEPFAQTDMAIEFMKNAKEGDDPFALFLSWGPPHDPWDYDNCPDEFIELFEDKEFPDPPNYAKGHARYWMPERDEQWYEENWEPQRKRMRKIYAAQTASIDWDFGRLLQKMEEMDLKKDTIIIFTSDHGEMFGSHGRIAKKIFYEEAIRVPFLIHWEDHITSTVSDVCFNSVDITPTLLGLLDLPIPDSYEGMDLSHFVRGEEGPEPEGALLQGMGHTYRWIDGDEWRGLRTKRYTYAWMLDDDTEYLFDNIDDPYQMVNLVDNPDYEEVYDNLRNMMMSKLEELNDPLKPTTWYRDHWVKDRVITKSATRTLEKKFRPENMNASSK